MRGRKPSTYSDNGSNQVDVLEDASAKSAKRRTKVNVMKTQTRKRTSVLSASSSTPPESTTPDAEDSTAGPSLSGSRLLCDICKVLPSVVFCNPHHQVFCRGCDVLSHRITENLSHQRFLLVDIPTDSADSCAPETVPSPTPERAINKVQDPVEVDDLLNFHNDFAESVLGTMKVELNAGDTPTLSSDPKDILTIKESQPTITPTVESNGDLTPVLLVLPSWEGFLDGAVQETAVKIDPPHPSPTNSSPDQALPTNTPTDQPVSQPSVPEPVRNILNSQNISSEAIPVPSSCHCASGAQITTSTSSLLQPNTPTLFDTCHKASLGHVESTTIETGLLRTGSNVSSACTSQETEISIPDSSAPEQTRQQTKSVKGPLSSSGKPRADPGSPSDRERKRKSPNASYPILPPSYRSSGSAKHWRDGSGRADRKVERRFESKDGRHGGRSERRGGILDMDEMDKRKGRYQRDSSEGLSEERNRSLAAGACFQDLDEVAPPAMLVSFEFDDL